MKNKVGKVGWVYYGCENRYGDGIGCEAGWVDGMCVCGVGLGFRPIGSLFMIGML
jgi:hypothetical protein